MLAAGLAFDGAGGLVRGARVRAALRDVPGLAVATVEIDPARDRVTLFGAALARDGVRVTAERIDVAARSGGWGPIGPAFADEPATTTSADNIRIETGDGSAILVPHIELRGASLTAALAALSGHAEDRAAAVSDALQKLTFESLTVPEFTVTHAPSAGDDKAGRFTLRNVLVSGVSGGRIAAMSADGALLTETRDGKPRTFGEIGKMSAHAVDVGLASVMATRARTDADEALHPLLESLEIDGISVEPDPGQTLHLDSFEYAGFKGRPLLLDPKRAAQLSNKPESDRSEAERTQLAGYVIDAIASFSLDRFEIKGFRFSGNAGRDPVGFDLGDFRIEDLGGAKVKSVSADGFHLNSPEAKVAFSRFALNGLDQSGMMNVLAKAINGRVPPSGPELASLSPKLSDVSLRDLAVSAVAKDGNGNVDDGRTVKVDIPIIEAVVSPAAAGSPTAVTARYQVIYDVLSPTPGSGLDQAKQNGFDHFDVSSDYALSWDEPSRIAKIGHVTVAAKDLAAFSMGASVSGVSRQLLSGDKAALDSAAKDVRLLSFDVTLTNSGLAEKAYPLAAKGSDVTVPALKEALKQQVDQSIASTLGDEPAAKQIGAAVDAFIDDPGTLSVSVAVPGGLDFQTLADIKTPAELLSRLTVTATATKGSVPMVP